MSAVPLPTESRLAVSRLELSGRFTVSSPPGLWLALVVISLTFENWTIARPGDAIEPAYSPVAVTVSASESTLL